ncbi:MAG: hypothetical protein CMP54_00635 [Flavobacteriales bacterium]|nr:hypothetical protein [Flavobacteriales bacterium]|tara:strand:- start:1235 stop:1483 length:249 start_codon:yes stop_codon:yes gene_type:complete
MNKRFTQKYEPMRKLDLHGVRHGEVQILVEDFVLENQNYLPIKIITGNSEKMKRIVTNVLNAHGFQYSDGDFYNRGYIDVLN